MDARERATRLCAELIDRLPQGVLLWQLEDEGNSATFRLLAVNPAASACVGVDVGSRLGETMLEIFPGSEPAVYLAVLRDGVPRHLGHRIYEDEQIPKSVFSVMALPLSERVVGVVFENVTSSTSVSDALRRANAFLDSIVENIPNMIFVKEAADLRFERFNRAGEDLLGVRRSALLGKNDYDFFPKDQADFFQQKDRDTLRRGAVLDIPEEPIQTPSGERWLHTRKIPILDEQGRPTHLLGISEDITEQRRAQRELEDAHAALGTAYRQLKQTQSQLVQAEKLASLGQLVAGIAHEINNPLAFVGNNLAVLDRDVRDIASVLRLYEDAKGTLDAAEPALMQRVREIEERADLGYVLENLGGLIARTREGLRRIQQIVTDLRNFARLDESDLQEADLNAGIESTLNILAGLAKKRDVELSAELAPLEPVPCHPAKINQVVMNLVVNAIDATPAGGRVVVRTSPEPQGVSIAVCDTGCGVDPKIRDKLFDPFFTTKPPGKGTGLGLSISYGIVKDHGGAIDVASTLGEGSCFTVRLPRRALGAR